MILNKLFKKYYLIYLFTVISLYSSCNNTNEKSSKKINEGEKNYVDSLIKEAFVLNNNLENPNCKTLILRALKSSEQNRYFSGEIKSNYVLCSYYFNAQIYDSCIIIGDKVLALAEGKVLNEKDLENTILTMTTLAILYANTGNQSISYRYYLKTEELVKNIKDLDFLLDYYGRLAFTFYKLSQFSEAHTFYYKKLKVLRLFNPKNRDDINLQGIFRDIGLTFYN